MNLDRIAVIGCGLIGGSLCRAIKQKRKETQILCIDRLKNRDAIIEEGISNEVYGIEEWHPVLDGTQLVVIATPVDIIPQIFGIISPYLEEGTIVTDMGSTKASIMAEAQKILPTHVHFIGGHPIAGSEKSGVYATDPLLFNKRPYILCPYPDTPSDILLSLIDLVEDLGAYPITVEPDEHDRILATVSHVPHLVAIAMVHAAFEDDSNHQLLEQVAGKGFLDLTRVASSPSWVWKGILESNKDSVAQAFEQFEKSIGEVRQALESGSITEFWENVAARRRKMTPESLPLRRTVDARAIIDDCDVQLLRILSKRFRATERIGRIKKSKGTAVLDSDREQNMKKKRAQYSKTLGLPLDFVENLFQLIVTYSKNVQNKLSRPDSP